MLITVLSVKVKSNTGNISLQLGATCRATLLLCKLQSFVARIINMLPKVEPISSSCNMLLQLATLKFAARQVACGSGNTGNKALQLAKQQCCRVRDVARITWP